jgi:ADP-heptose:LPS heptosyltransferase
MMFSKLSRSSKIKRILVVSLSNIGDVVLTLPVVDVLRAAFPAAEFHLIIGPKARTMFEGNPFITRVIIYNKKMSWREKLSWFWSLRSLRFDLVVDLRNSMLPFLLNAGTVTPPAVASFHGHMKAKHLARLALVFDRGDVVADRVAITLSPQQMACVDTLVHGWRDYALVAPGAADTRKRWTEEGFLQVVRHLHLQGKKVVLVGDQNDKVIGSRIAAAFSEGVLDLCGQTTLVELSGVIARAAFAVTNDSGIMHMASYFDRPVVALFGRTDPFFYGPWSSRCVVLRKGVTMQDIAPQDVIIEVDKFLC